jgi:hypothetical protein
MRSKLTWLKSCLVDVVCFFLEIIIRIIDTTFSLFLSEPFVLFVPS